MLKALLHGTTVAPPRCSNDALGRRVVPCKQFFGCDNAWSRRLKESNMSTVGSTVGATSRGVNTALNGRATGCYNYANFDQ
jgi:hypothetical protein